MVAQLPVKPVIVAGSVLVAVGLVLVAAVLRPAASSPASSSTAAGSTEQRTAFPAPPAGAVVYARQWGGDGLALGVVPQAGQVLAQASVVGPQGTGVSGLSVSLNGQAANACGPGCYRTTLHGTPPAIDVRVRSTRWHVTLPATWPPPDARALLARAEAAWRSLQSLSFHESLASDSKHSTISSWRIEAPDRVAYEVVGGWAGIVVGDRRWDRSPTSKAWVSSPQTRLTQPIPGWVRVTDAHILGQATLHGRPVWRVSFFDPETPGWFTLMIDKQTARTLDVHMTATAHFMHDAYSAFNTTPAVTPPK